MAIYVPGGMFSCISAYDIDETTNECNLVTIGACEISGFFHTVTGFIQELNKKRWYISDDISDWIFDNESSQLIFYQKVEKKYLTYDKDTIKHLNPNTDYVYIHAEIPIKYVSDPVDVSADCKDISDIPAITDEQREYFKAIYLNTSY